jgi:hypothetical protein
MLTDGELLKATEKDHEWLCRRRQAYYKQTPTSSRAAVYTKAEGRQRSYREQVCILNDPLLSNLHQMAHNSLASFAFRFVRGSCRFSYSPGSQSALTA